ncbi:MAG: hypothetical protein RIK87_06795 [Fuerstiella sp.]
MSDNPYADNYNPFQPPEESAEAGEGFSDTHVESVRRQHLSHEASVQSIGVLYLLGGIVLLVVSIGMIVVSVNGGGGQKPDTVTAVLLLGVGVLQCVTAVGLRRLRRWARVISGILSGIGLLAFPVGTLINGYILFLLFSAKGSMVFSEEYQQVIRQTPHIVYRTSIVVWIFLFLLLGLIALAFSFALFAG